MKYFTNFHRFSRWNLSILLLVLLSFCVNTKAANEFDQIIDEIGYTFNNENGQATVSYVRNFSQSECTIPSSVTYNGQEFQVTEIANQAFYSTNNIVKLTIPASVTKVDDNAFYGMNSLAIITFNSPMPPSEQLYIWKEDGNRYSQKSVNVLVPSYALQEYKSKWKRSQQYIYALGTVDVSTATDGFTYIVNRETMSASVLFVPNSEKCIIPSETTFEDRTFKVTSLEIGCFDQKDQIKEIDIPASITNINSQECKGCNSLNNVTMRSTTPPQGWISCWKTEESSTKITNLFIMVPTEAIETYETWSKNASYSAYRTILAIGSEFLTAEDGLQYITNKDTKEAEVYKGIDKEAVTIPETVTIEGNTYTVTSISNNSFADLNNVKSINLPKTLTKLPSSGGICDNNDLTITINSTTPPTGSPSSLEGYEKEVVEETNRYGTYEVTYLATSNTIVFVPTEALDAYKKWGEDEQNIRIFPIGNLAHFVTVNGNKYLIDPESESTVLIRAYKEGNYLIPENIEVEGKKYTVNTIGSYSIEKFCNKITLPNSITNIENYACWDNSGVTILTIPEGITSIGQSAFTFNNLEELTLPSTLKTVGYKFLSSSKIKTVTCKATTPPTFVVPEYFSEDDYLEQYKLKNATLYVPEGTEEAYKVAKGWKLFYTVENTPTNIKAATSNAPKPQIITNGKDIEVTGLDNNEIVSLYNAEGKLQSTAIVHNGAATLTKPATGNLFIIKSKNATIKLAIK